MIHRYGWARSLARLATGAKAAGKANPMATLTEPQSHTLTVNDLTLHYLEWERAEAPPIVCVHGYTSSAQAFNALARHLQDRYRILALDVRGHRKSAWSPTGGYRYADQASDLAAFAKQLGLDKFVLIGTSMGGIIAMAYAAEHADRLRGLVINHIGPDAEAGTQRITQMVGSRPNDFATLEDAMAYRRATSPITAARSEADQRELALGVAAPARGRPLGVEVGPGLYPPTRRTRAAGAAATGAGIARAQLPNPGGVGDGERCPLRGAGAAHGRRAAARRTGARARHRSCADPGRTGGARGTRPLSGSGVKACRAETTGI
jgi:pimeloyl-ACP methyl ester carboxylesterase